MMACSVNVKRKDGTSVLIPNMESMPVPLVGQTIRVLIDGEIVLLRVTGLKRHYLGGDIDNPLHAIEGEEV